MEIFSLQHKAKESIFLKEPMTGWWDRALRGAEGIGSSPSNSWGSSPLLLVFCTDTEFFCGAPVNVIRQRQVPMLPLPLVLPAPPYLCNPSHPPQKRAPPSSLQCRLSNGRPRCWHPLPQGVEERFVPTSTSTQFPRASGSLLTPHGGSRLSDPPLRSCTQGCAPSWHSICPY